LGFGGTQAKGEKERIYRAGRPSAFLPTWEGGGGQPNQGGHLFGPTCHKKDTVLLEKPRKKGCEISKKERERSKVVDNGGGGD